MKSENRGVTAPNVCMREKGRHKKRDERKIKGAQIDTRQRS